MRESGGDSEDREGSTREWRQGRKQIREEWGKRRWSRGDSWRDWRARERVGKESGIERMR